MKRNFSVKSKWTIAHNDGWTISLEYWQSLASSTRLLGRTLEECLATLHRDITSSWNFNDPDNVSFLLCTLWVAVLI
jgi:hypothetical protein